MFVWSKRPGEPSRFRFSWWPLVLGVALSILLTLVLNALV